VRIVLDTNIFVSALLSRVGPPGQVLESVRHGGHVFITSRFQLDELGRVLSSERLKPLVRPGEAEDLLETVASIGVCFETLPAVNYSPDPDDNPILAAAIAGEADFIVSGDKRHMLSLGAVEGIAIITARDAMTRYLR
jgi:uncharacterized protein